MSERTQSRRTLASIDALKGLAIIGVMAQHGLPEHALRDVGADFHIRQAVPILFVLLGYNAARPALERAPMRLADAYGRTYAENRLWRIAVPFAAVWIAALVAGTFADKLHFGPLTLAGVLPVPGPGNYFVTILFTFVLLQPAWVEAFRRRPLLVLALAVLANVVFELVAGSLPSLEDGGYPYGYDASILRYSAAIAVGMWLALPGVQARRGRLAVFALAPLSVAYLVAIRLERDAFDFLVPGFGIPTNFAVVPLSAALMLAFLRLWPDDGVRGTGWLTRLGRASYHVFLVQIAWYGLLPDQHVWRLPLDVLVCGVLGWLLLRVLPAPPSQSAAQPSGAARGGMLLTALRGGSEVSRLSSPLVTGGAVLVLAGVAALICGDTADLVNFDSRWALIWGRDLAEGGLGTYGGGPTPHPLTIGLGAVVAPLGEHGAATAFSWLLGYLSLGLLAVMTFRLTRALSTTLAAVVAAALVFLNFTILVTGAASYLDVLFAALVITALALEVERPRRGVAPLVVLLLAGMLRPEAWGLAGLYWLYVVLGADRRQRLIMLALVAAAPLVWLGMDTLVEGRPTYSFTSTRSASENLYGRFSVLENLEQGFTDLKSYVPLALLAGAIAGIAVLASRRRWLAAVPAATLAITAGFFVFLAITGLPTNGRYLLVPAVLLLVALGAGAGEWLSERSSRPLLAVGLVLCVVAGVQLVKDMRGLDGVKPFLASVSEPWADLRELRDEADADLARCRVIGLPSPVARPYVMYAFDLPSRDVVVHEPGVAVDALLLPRSAEATAVVSRARFGIEGAAAAPAGYREVAVGEHWSFLSPTGSC